MNIYVSNLGFDVNSEDLSTAFKAFGEVTSANVIMDKFTQKSRGFAFVEMPNKEEAEKAIKELNGATFEDRVMNVSEAKEREPREGGFNRTPSPFNNDNKSYPKKR
ncbi:RNA recognition motif domain-containing protein [Rhizosphaericola mali]|uniref:RNA-binding protein n=1 Tax=Rhizosphaericola mali TaxID=2545455 RepID=A0A5P2G2I0_9BACT|nr:RNA-binding protein [Rhizosphaericola mali]QES88032.1 RNA-binding protein [Rhizosphaericola mali]